MVSDPLRERTKPVPQRRPQTRANRPAIQALRLSPLRSTRGAAETARPCGRSRRAAERAAPPRLRGVNPAFSCPPFRPGSFARAHPLSRLERRGRPLRVPGFCFPGVPASGRPLSLSSKSSAFFSFTCGWGSSGRKNPVVPTSEGGEGCCCISEAAGVEVRAMREGLLDLSIVERPTRWPAPTQPRRALDPSLHPPGAFGLRAGLVGHRAQVNVTGRTSCPAMRSRRWLHLLRNAPAHWLAARS